MIRLLPNREKRYLCLLFTETLLRVAKLDNQGKSLEKFFEFSLPPGVIIDGEVKDVAKLGEVLKQVREKVGAKESFVVVGIPETKASIHTLLLPKLNPEEIYQAIRLQADSFLPFAYQNEYLDWMIIGEEQEGQIKVLVSAVPRGAIDSFVNALQAAQFAPLSFETTSLSLFRLLPEEGKRLSFASEFGETSVVLILGREGNVEACTVIGRQDQFIETVQKVKDFYLRLNEEAQPKEIYLCGKDIQNSLLEQIQTKLNLKPILLKPTIGGLPQDRSPELAILVSLVQKKVAPPEDVNTINILPPELTEKYTQIAEEKRRQRLTLSSILLLTIFNLLISLSYFQLKTKSSLLKSQIDQSWISKGNQLSNLLLFKEKAALINRLTLQNKPLTELINLFNFSSPEIEISGFNFGSKNKEIVLTGRAKTKEDLLKLKEKLEHEKSFNKIYIPLSSLEHEERIEFVIKLSI